MRGALRSERGQALVEFALVLPVFALLLFAIVQFGVVFTQYLALTDAVRRAGVNLRQADLAVAVTPAAPWQRGNPVTVSGSYPYAIDLLGVVVKSGRLSSTTTERVE